MNGGMIGFSTTMLRNRGITGVLLLLMKVWHKTSTARFTAPLAFWLIRA